MSMSFKCIWVDCTYKTANLGKLKIVSRGSSHRVYWKRHFTFARRAVLQLLSRSCLLWCAPWPFGSIFEANYIITQKENALISIWLVIFCISWMHWRLQTTCSIIVLLSFFSRSHSEPQMSSKDWKKINAKKKINQNDMVEFNLSKWRGRRTEEQFFSSISRRQILINRICYLLIWNSNNNFPMFLKILRVSITHILTCLF